MKPNHTPGPWTLVHDGPYEVTIEKDGRRVPGLKVWLDDACFDGNAERLANAQLAAAAPELLEALRDYVRMVHEREPGDRTQSCPCTTCERARAAIAKAEGHR